MTGCFVVCPAPPLRSGRTRPRPLTRPWLSATARSTPSPHCCSDSPGGACLPSLRSGRVAFASYASASLRPDPATASDEALASLQVSRDSCESLSAFQPSAADMLSHLSTFKWLLWDTWDCLYLKISSICIKRIKLKHSIFKGFIYSILLCLCLCKMIW